MLNVGIILLAVLVLQLFSISHDIKAVARALNESLAEIRTTLDEVTEAVESVDASVSAVETAVQSLSD